MLQPYIQSYEFCRPLLKIPFLYRHTLTCWGFEVGLLLFLNGLCVVVCCAFVHGECGDLLVGFPTMVAVVRFAGCMNNVVFVKAGVFCEALFAPRHCTHIWFLSWGSRKTVRLLVLFVYYYCKKVVKTTVFISGTQE